MLGTAILVAIVGEPASLSQALDASDDAYMFAVLASLASGAVVLGLRRAVREEQLPVPLAAAPLTDQASRSG